MPGQPAGTHAAAPRQAAALSLAPLRAAPLKEQVVAELMRLVEDGTLAPGARLPGERSLADRLAVSRGTVREAVQFLEALGVVEIRHGSGTYVLATAEPAHRSAAWRAWTRRNSGRVRDLLEVRQGLESFAAELAARRGSRAARDALRKALEQMEGAVDGHDVPLLVRIDVSFHQAVVEAAGNVALSELMNAIGAQLVQERAATWDQPGRPARSLAEHKAIYEAIAAGNADGARAAVVGHLESIARDVDRIAAAQTEAVAGRRPIGQAT